MGRLTRHGQLPLTMLFSKLIGVFLAVLGSARPERICSRYQIDDLTHILSDRACAYYAPLKRLVDTQGPGPILLLVEVCGAGQFLLCLCKIITL